MYHFPNDKKKKYIRFNIILDLGWTRVEALDQYNVHGSMV